MSLFLKKDDSIFNKQKFNSSTFYDRPNQGFSNQPFIVKNPDSELKNNSNDKDFLVRGGTKLGSSIIDDEIRLTKLFFNPKSLQGILFTAKQTLLSRLNVDSDFNRLNLLNQGIYTPGSTLLNAALAPVGIHSPLFINQFNYGEFFKNNKDESQLVDLNKKREEGEFKDSNILKTYKGGPGSTAGIGSTKISFTDKKTTSTTKPEDTIKIKDLTTTSLVNKITESINDVSKKSVTFNQNYLKDNNYIIQGTASLAKGNYIPSTPFK